MRPEVERGPGPLTFVDGGMVASRFSCVKWLRA